MNLIFLAIVAMLTTYNVLIRRTIEERNIRWKLYALRDKLRWLVINDETRRDSPLFHRLDHTLTGYCSALGWISIWTILPFVLSSSARRSSDLDYKVFENQLRDPENKDMLKIYRQSVNLVVAHLVLRHLVLVTIAVITIVGVVPIALVIMKLAKRAVAGSLNVANVSTPLTTTINATA